MFKISYNFLNYFYLTQYLWFSPAPQGEKCVPVAVGGSNQSTLIIQDKNSSQILGVVLPSKHGDKPKRGSSTALFFRKFYHLAFVRLQDLCKNLNIEDDVLRKIWTCLQQSVVSYVVDLMKGRHLDQIIMCCVYVVSKVKKTLQSSINICTSNFYTCKLFDLENYVLFVTGHW